MLEFHLAKLTNLPPADEALSNAYFGQGTGQIVLDDVNCSGSENQLLTCNRGALVSANCDHSDDAGVRCEGTYRTRSTVLQFLVNIMWSIHASQCNKLT